MFREQNNWKQSGCSLDFFFNERSSYSFPHGMVNSNNNNDHLSQRPYLYGWKVSDVAAYSRFGAAEPQQCQIKHTEQRVRHCSVQTAAPRVAPANSGRHQRHSTHRALTSAAHHKLEHSHHAWGAAPHHSHHSRDISKCQDGELIRAQQQMEWEEWKLTCDDVPGKVSLSVQVI